jgi:hypothetical protein
MVEKQIEFYFSKHPHTELDCGWSRKGSSNSERSLFMANNTKFNKQETQRTATLINCAYKPDLFATALRIEKALSKGLIFVKVRFEYVDPNDSSFNEDDFAFGTIHFNEFEALVNYLLYEFNCVKLTDRKPIRRFPCYHEVEAVFTRQEGTV